MTQKCKFALSIVLLGAAAWFTPTVKADEWDKLTALTFNDPVEIPGQVLPAGTYVFKLLDSPSDRTIVQVYTEDQKHLLATILAIPDYRLDPTDKTVVTLDERAAGLPQAIHTWFYPGDNYGLQFVYKKPGMQLAKTEPAEATPAPPAPQQASAEPATVEQAPAGPPCEEVVVREQEVIIAQAFVSLDSALPAELPKTAGNFAIIPLLGIMLLSAGFTAFRFTRTQS